MNHHFKLCLFVAPLIVALLTLPAEGKQDSLPNDVLEAMKQINENRVRATISFLASDELGGRDTPSDGLNIASAYVAARFRGAGLEPLGDKAFYQTTKVDTVQLPTTGSVMIDGQPLTVLGVLAAGKETLDWTGELFVIDKQTPRDQTFEGAVVVTAPSFEDRRAARNFQFQLLRLQQNGAKAILIQVDPEHELVKRASQSQSPKLAGGRTNVKVPTMLIPTGEINGEANLSLAKLTQGKTEVKNVIGVLKGSDPEMAKEAIIISAHLDHIGQFSGAGDTINNGADDDATGVTGVLSLADAFAALPNRPKRSIIFMTFWGEEKGMLGSKHYADSPAWPLKKTVANINLEMLGRPEPGAAGKVWMTGWDKSDLGKLMAQGAKGAGVMIFEHPSFSAMLYQSSDNISFVRKGVVAHSFSAGSLHKDYHKPTDEWEKLQLDHMTKVIQGLFAGTLPLANGEVTPK